MIPIATLIQLLGPLLAGAAQKQASAVNPTAGEEAQPSVSPGDLASLAAIIASSQRPAEPLPNPKLPVWIGAIGVIIALSFTGLLAAIIWMHLNGHSGQIGELQYALGLLSALLVMVAMFAFGSSWGSRTKDARPATEPAGAPIVLPPIAPPPPTTIEPTAPTAPVEPVGPTEPVGTAYDDARFLASVQIIDKWEGGYSNDPQDAGGPTNHGITQADLSEWIGRPASVADVKAMSLDTAHQIFRERYWDPLKCDQLPPGLALMTFNCGVNSGVSRGAKFLQRTLGIAEDGVVGPETIAAATRADQNLAVADYSATYEAFYRGLSNFSTFGRGWLNRLRDVTEAAMALASAGPVAPAQASPAKPADLAEAIAAAMRRKGYKLDTGPGEVNIVYVEGMSEDGTVNDDAPDKWNDLRAVIGFDGDKPVILGKWAATTEPGRYYTESPINPGGAARIEFGQYPAAWRVGVHRGDHAALVQRGPVTVCRDLNKDMIRTGDARDTGSGFAINQHGPSGADEAPASVGKYSAGCLVGKTMAGHRSFMAIVRSDPRFLADEDYLFSTAILAEADVVQT